MKESINNMDNKKQIDFIKDKLSDKASIYEFVYNNLEKDGFIISDRKEGNIPIQNSKNKKTCYIDFLVEYQNYGHPVARFCENLPFSDERIIKFEKNVSKYSKRKSTWLKEGHEKWNIALKSDKDLELIKAACLSIS